MTFQAFISGYPPTAISWIDLTIENQADICSVVNPLSLANVRGVKEGGQTRNDSSSLGKMNDAYRRSSPKKDLPTILEVTEKILHDSTIIWKDLVGSYTGFEGSHCDAQGSDPVTITAQDPSRVL